MSKQVSDLTMRTRRAVGELSKITAELLNQISQLEAKLKAQEKAMLEREVMQVQISHHERAINERNRAVKLANDLLHDERLKNVKAAREITALKQRILKELNNGQPTEQQHRLHRQSGS